MDDGRRSGQSPAEQGGVPAGPPVGAVSGADETIDPSAGPSKADARPSTGPTGADALETLARPIPTPSDPGATCDIAAPPTDPAATCELPAPTTDPDATCLLPAPPADPDATCVLPAPASPADPQMTVDLGAVDAHRPSLVIRDSAIGSSLGGGSGSPRVPGQPWVEGYVMEGELGRGGMGVVYKARQPKLRRTVAIKMIRAAGLASEEHVARFYAEARAVAALQHVNIVQIHDIGESETLPYFSLEFVPGSSLDKKLAKQPQPPLESATLIETLARAMHYAHQHGIVHRDLKPANVLLTEEGIPKITDFGLAKDTGEDSGMSRDGQAMGTPSYMPPEQARGDLAVLGPKADVYALGAILYEMLVGRPPFLGANAYDTLLQVLKNDPIAPSQLVPRLPKDVETICLKCLEKDPDKRYGSALDLAEDCRRYVAGEPILSRPISAPERAWRWCKRNPRMAILVATVAGLLVTVAAGSTLAAMVILAERNAKEEQRKVAVSAKEFAEKQESIAKHNEEIAKREQKIATEQSQLAFGSLETLIGDVYEKLDDAPRTLQVKLDLLETAIKSFEKVQAVKERAEQGSDSSVDAVLQKAYLQQFETARQLGDHETAIAALEHALGQARQRAAAKAAEVGEHDGSRYNVASLAANLGTMKMAYRRDPAAALQDFDEAMQIVRELIAKPRSAGEGNGQITEQELASLADEVRSMIGNLHYLQGDPAAATPLFREALEARRAAAAAAPDDRETKRALARSIKATGETAFLLGDRTGGFALYDESLALHRELAEPGQEDHAILEDRVTLAITEGDYGDLCLRTDDLSGAEAHYDASVAGLEALAEQDATNAEVAHELGLALYRRGQLARRAGDAAKAERCFGESLRQRERLAAADPSNLAWRMNLMLSLAQAGERTRAVEIAESLPTTRGDRELLLSIAKCFAIAARDTSGDERGTFTDRAIATLDSAIAAGYRDAVILRTDPDLEPVRNDPRYPTIEIPTVAPPSAS